MRYLIIALLTTACGQMNPPERVNNRTATPNDTKETTTKVEYVPGPKGENGKDGRDGIDGKDGKDGRDGYSCSVTNVSANSVAPNGGAMISCEDGTNTLVLNGINGTNGINGRDGVDGQDGKDGVDGVDGQDGRDGINGTNGADGKDAAPGTIVQSVQFCSGVTSYPAKFNEVGFCVAGKLYAVYSANGGFMAEIPPGTYSSNGINSSCTFTVGLNCQVTR